jgi:polyketide cyclase/dehydrase/lipid transport protein
VPVVEARVVVPVSPQTAFWVSQTTAPVRYRWDPFVRSQRLIGAELPGKGVRTETVSRHRLRMISEYVSFNPPRNVGMKMIKGPWFFEHFGGGWRFEAGPQPGTAIAIWRYNFTVRPPWLRPIADRIGRWLLGRDIRRRIDGFAGGCRDQTVLAAADEARIKSAPHNA